MSTEMGESMIKETLKSLSCNNGWSYGVFWHFDQKNSLFLTFRDSYCEERMGDVIDDMLLQVHILGQGVIGQAAFTKKHRWMFSDSHFGKLSSTGSSDIFQDHSEFDYQFSIGIKTIAIISVEPLGVVQFGSNHKLAERLEFVSQTKELFRSIEILQGLALSENEPLPSSSDAWDASGVFASLLSCQSTNFASPVFRHGDSFEDFMETDCSLENITEPFPSTSDYEKMDPLVTASSLNENRLRIVNAEAHVDPNVNRSDFQAQQSLMESNGFCEPSACQGPYNSTWSNSDVQESSMLNSISNSELFIDVAKTSQQFFRNKISNQNFGQLLQSGGDHLQRPSTVCTFEELLPNIDFGKVVSKHCTNDDIFQCFCPMTDENKEMVKAKLRNDLSCTSEVVSLSSNPKGHHAPTNIISDNQPSASVQSSVTNGSEKEKSSDIFGIDKRFDCSGVDIGSKFHRDWEDIIMPLEIGGHLVSSSSSSGCISEQYVDSKLRTANTLFTKLGLQQRLDEIDRGSCSLARSDFRDQVSSTAKRRKIGSPLLCSNEVNCLPRFVGNVNSAQPAYPLNSTNNFESRDKVIKRLEADSCIGDSCSIVAGNAVSSSNKLEQPAKTIKKKAKAGTKPRPKDRQQIHDRLLELRELIPNGEKMRKKNISENNDTPMSIDRLLHLTIKHLLFLQRVASHAERLDQTDGQKSGIVWKEKLNSSNGVTWACEVGDETMFCPLIVEDLSVPGQMLIEILCEEQGFFLEIVDIIRAFGLTILKGVMEVRETKIWSRFTVEAEENRHVSRHEIFSSLVQLLQLTGPTGVHKSDNVMDGGSTLFNSCQKSAAPHPVSLARVDA